MKNILSVLAGLLLDIFIGAMFTICIVVPIAYFTFGVDSFDTMLKIAVWSWFLVSFISPFGSGLAKGLRNEED